MQDQQRPVANSQHSAQMMKGIERTVVRSCDAPVLLESRRGDAKPHTFHMPLTLRPGRGVQDSTLAASDDDEQYISSSRGGDQQGPVAETGPGCSLFSMSILRPRTSLEK